MPRSISVQKILAALAVVTVAGCAAGPAVSRPSLSMPRSDLSTSTTEPRQQLPSVLLQTVADASRALKDAGVTALVNSYRISGVEDGPDDIVVGQTEPSPLGVVGLIVARPDEVVIGMASPLPYASDIGVVRTIRADANQMNAYLVIGPTADPSTSADECVQRLRKVASSEIDRPEVYCWVFSSAAEFEAAELQPDGAFGKLCALADAGAGVGEKTATIQVHEQPDRDLAGCPGSPEPEVDPTTTTDGDSLGTPVPTRIEGVLRPSAGTFSAEKQTGESGPSDPLVEVITTTAPMADLVAWYDLVMPPSAPFGGWEPCSQSVLDSLAERTWYRPGTQDVLRVTIGTEGSGSYVVIARFGYCDKAMAP